MHCAYFIHSFEGHAANFDSVANACMIIIQIITFDTWSDVMYDLMRAFSPLVCIYFLAVALLGGFFLVNLFVGVV